MSADARVRVAVICADRGVPLLGLGGASAHLRGIAEGYRDLGCRTELWVARVAPGPDRASVPLPAGIDVHEGPRGRLPGMLRRYPHWDGLVDGAAFARSVGRHASRFRPHLAHERHALYGGAGAAAQKQGAAWVLEVNAPMLWEGALFRGVVPTLPMRRGEDATLRGADAVFAVSEPLASWVRLRRPDVRVLPNGVAASVEAARPPQDGPFVLGHEGSYKPWHGLPDAVSLLPAFAATLNRPLHVACAGVGPAYAETKVALDQLAGAGLLTWQALGELDAAGLTVARRRWSAAWSPQAPWPPPLPDGLLRTLREPLPPRWFAPLKDAEAAAAGLPLLRDLTLLPVASPPPTWRELAAEVLALVGPPTS